MLTVKVFQCGNNQAIRLPKELHTNQHEFFIQRFGDGFILFPINDPWAVLCASIGAVPQDFTENREQPSCENIPEEEAL